MNIMSFVLLVVVTFPVFCASRADGQKTADVALKATLNVRGKKTFIPNTNMSEM